MISHVNSNESNNFNTSNSNNTIVTSNLPNSNVKSESSFNTLITFKIYSESSAIINEEITDQVNISE